MNVADRLRISADQFSNTASIAGEEKRQVHFSIASQLRKMAAVFEVHGYAGLMGYLACYDYGTPASDQKRAVLDATQRVMKGSF